VSKLNQWLTLTANLSVVAGIVFLAIEMRQNTDMMRAQIRDSMTEKQMEFYGWMATSRDLSDVLSRGFAGAELDATDRQMANGFRDGVFREWENSWYQYQQGLFEPDEFLVRMERWKRGLVTPLFQDRWVDQQASFSPSFRAEINRILAEMEQAP